MPHIRPRVRRSSWWILASVLPLLGAAPQRDRRGGGAEPGTAPADDARTWIQMRRVDLRFSDHGVMHVRELHGEVLSRTPGTAAILDDPTSFSIRITSATVALTGDDLSTLLNEVVFAYDGSPLKRLKVKTKGNQIVQSGVMHKGVDIPFTMTASLSLAPDGRIRIHATDMRIFGVDGQKLLHALGLHLSKLLDLSGSRGAAVVGDDIYLDVSRAVPPPSIVGRLASVRVEGNEIVQEFVRTPDDSMFGSFVRPDTSARNFVYFRGGGLRFGKLLMSDTDLQINDADSRDPFDMYLVRYAKQLVAGTSRTLPNQGLQVVMPDYTKIR